MGVDGLYRIQTLDLCDTGAALYPTEQASQLGTGHYKNRSFPGFKPFTKIGHLRIITFKMRLSAE